MGHPVIGKGRLIAALVAGLACAPLAAQTGASGGGKRLVCWTDEHGIRTCGDSVPPRYADKERQVLDRAGRTVKVIPGAMTPEQRAAHEAAKARETEAQREAERQAAYDRALLNTYTRPQELAALRDDRLATVDTRIRLTESAAARDAVAVAELRARLPQEGSGKKPGARLQASIAEFETSLAANQRAVADMRKQREEICKTFTRDIHRFQELKHGRVDYDSPCPAPDAFAPDAEKPLDLDTARAFFQQYADLERRFDPARFTLYANDAVVKLAQPGEDGQPETLELTLDEHRERELKALPRAQARVDTYSYQDLAFDAQKDGRVQVRARRISDLDRSSASFALVLQPRGQDWEVVELRSGDVTP